MAQFAGHLIEGKSPALLSGIHHSLVFAPYVVFSGIVYSPKQTPISEPALDFTGSPIVISFGGWMQKPDAVMQVARNKWPDADVVGIYARGVDCRDTAEETFPDGQARSD
jgi:hypothetical protein